MESDEEPTYAERTLVDTGGDGLDSSDRPRGERTDLARGTILGRYVVLDKVGAGGMGVVFAAYDPELDRKVAIKLLVVSEQGTSGSTTGRSRLLREAQALAKLSHPNVVAIFDVGTVAQRVWLAMEFVEGATLGQWLRAEPRGWREIRAVLAAAGAGLTAAHGKGMLHRDFKPDNVMVGTDGRVRVMDFGLARAREDGDGPRSSSALYESSVREATALHGDTPDPKLLLSQMTEAGALLGTPAYLAPEVFRGDRWSAAADQFAFCVTLWEALYGERPFAGESLVELATHVLEGTMRPAPRGRGVPGWLRRVCLRGLLVDPERRWPAMTELLAAMQRDPGQTRRRFGIGVGMAAVVAGGFGWSALQDRREFQACVAHSHDIERVWNPERRAWLDARLSEVGSSYARETAQRVVSALDGYAATWTQHRALSCGRGGEDERSQLLSSELREVQDQCFGARAEALSALVEVLGAGDPERLRHAVVAAIELPGAAQCLDERTLRRSSGINASGERHAATRSELIAARVLLKAGQFDEAAAHASRALELAEAMAAPPLIAEARYLAGAVAHRAGEYAPAEALLRTAYFDAFRLGREDLAASAAITLTHLHSVGRVQVELAGVWLELARGLADRMDHDDPVMRADLATAAATLATERADYGEAETRMREAIEIREANYGGTHPDIGLMYGHLAELHDDAGDFAAAEAAAIKGLELLETSLGPTHPDNSQAIFALATAAWKTGRGAESLELSKRVLTLRVDAFGPAHISVAEALNSVGNAHIQMGDWKGADEAHSRALEIRRTVYGPDEPRVATSLVNLADVAVHAGRHDEGIEYARDSLRIWENKLGVDHAYCAYAHIVVGEAQLRAGRHAEALAAFDRGLEIRRAGDESEHQLAEPLTGRGAALIDLGRNDEALVALEQAWAIRERHPSAELHAPDTGFELARALWIRDTGGDRVRAVELARFARAAFESVATARPEGLVAVDAWLASRASQAGADVTQP